MKSAVPAWSRSAPTVQGRYWWRAPDRFKRPGIEHMSYGLVLVQWVQHGEYAPSLRIVSVSTFNAGYGGEMSTSGGWSYGSGHLPAEFEQHHPGVEFWSEPEHGPGGFLPELGGKPDWTPPDPKVIEAERQKDAAKAAKREKEEIDERTDRVTKAKEAGLVLYSCDSCDTIYDENELVEVRECTHCDEKFDGSEGRNCPSCNRPFTRKVCERGCSECLEEEDCGPLLPEFALPEPKSEPSPSKKKRQSRRR
jgi:hypothetical protein